jgi:sulfide:quinone oxidoreductase
MEQLKRVVILGAGFAGLRAMQQLKEYDYHFEVTIVEKREFSLEKPALPEVAMEGKSVDGVHIEVGPQARANSAAFVSGEVIAIDPKEQSVTLDTGVELKYDYLIIATGAVKNYDAIKGFREFGYSVCDDEQAVRLNERLKSFEGGAIVTGAAKSEFGTTVKAPNLKAPCEGPIGEVMFMMHHRLKEEGKLEKSSINVFSPAEIFFEDVGDGAREPVAKVMQEKGISLTTNKELIEITETSIIFADGSTLPCDLAIIIPPYKAPKFIAKSGIGDDKGWVPVDESMQHINYPNILAAGDVSALAQPKLGHIAINQADVAVSSILKAENIEHDEVSFNPEVFCIMNMGGFDATLIYSNALYGGEYDMAWHSPIAKLMKTSFDEEYHITHGHMPPDIAVKALETVLHVFGKAKK